MGEPIQRVSVPSYVEKAGVRPYVAYTVRIEMQVIEWQVERRYSDFVTLHESFPTPPPVPLPPKDSAWRAVTTLGGLFASTDHTMLEERRRELDRYLRAIVTTQDPAWRNSMPFCDFIELPQHKPAQAPAAARELTPRHAAPSRPIFERPRPPAAETTDTRSLSNTELLERQRDTLMAKQDAQANALTTVLQRQRAIGMDIYDEIHRHRELLGDLDAAVEKTQRRLDSAHAQARRLE